MAGQLVRDHDCNPGTGVTGASVPFEFTEDGIKVGVALADLLTAINPGGTSSLGMRPCAGCL